MGSYGRIQYSYLLPNFINFLNFFMLSKTLSYLYFLLHYWKIINSIIHLTSSFQLLQVTVTALTNLFHSELSLWGEEKSAMFIEPLLMSPLCENEFNHPDLYYHTCSCRNQHSPKSKGSLTIGHDVFREIVS